MSSSSSSSAIKLVNNVAESNVASAEFRLSQGADRKNQIARLGVHAGAMAKIPTTTSYTAQAFTNMGDFTLTSNAVTFSNPSQNLLAQVLTEDGYFDFQLQAVSGNQPSAIVCENTWRQPVQFTIKQPGTPVQIITVADEHNNSIVSTAQQWECYAIVNGITTERVLTTNPNATFTLTADNNDDSYTLTVS
jgi:hypothetical protein